MAMSEPDFILNAKIYDSVKKTRVAPKNLDDSCLAINYAMFCKIITVALLLF